MNAGPESPGRHAAGHALPPFPIEGMVDADLHVFLFEMVPTTISAIRESGIEPVSGMLRLFTDGLRYAFEVMMIAGYMECYHGKKPADRIVEVRCGVKGPAGGPALAGERREGPAVGGERPSGSARNTEALVFAVQVSPGCGAARRLRHRCSWPSPSESAF